MHFISDLIRTNDHLTCFKTSWETQVPANPRRYTFFCADAIIIGKLFCKFNGSWCHAISYAPNPISPKLSVSRFPEWQKILNAISGIHDGANAIKNPWISPVTTS